MVKQSVILGVKLNAVNKEEVVDILLDYATNCKKKSVFYINAHCLNIAWKDARYRGILNSADLVYAGGMGVVWAARLLGAPLPERANILDFFDLLLVKLKHRKTSVYLLGNTGDIIKRASRSLKEKGLNVVGCHNGFFGGEEEERVIEEINHLQPDILMVGMGVPKQEKWIAQNIGRLNVRLCWGVGAAFDWLSGYRKMAPSWVIRNGLEWSHRLFQQPLRLWRRYLIGNLLFILRILAWKARK